MTRLGFLLVLCAGAADPQVNLVSKVIGLLQDLHTMVSADAAEVRRESGGRRPPTGNSPRRHCFHKNRHRERCRRGGKHWS